MNTLASTIDHTLLKPDATTEQVLVLCKEAREHSFASVCVLPWHVQHASDALMGSKVAVCTVVGFPLGSTFTASKVHETELAMFHGAREIDMVANISAIKSGDLDAVFADIREIVISVHERKGIVKVIIETGLLSESEKIDMCSIVTQAHADFIKTSTGFAGSGATLDDVRLLRAHSGQHVKVKASGGIRDHATAIAMIEAGAQRLGTSSGIAILQGGSSTNSY
ncbi:deoxyribose-phosphate aldolase [soil metagenome]